MPSLAFTVPGPVKFTAPPYVTSWYVECWGAANSGVALTTGGASGGGGGEYAAQQQATTPGVTYSGFVGRGGQRPGPGAGGFPGGVTTWQGGLVTAHGGQGTQGGTGSSNTVHHNGGNGGTSSGSAGAGGGASGAPSGAGGNGANGTSSPGNGGVPLPSGGYGGNGGSAGQSGLNGVSPGGGGGGAGKSTLAVPAYGGRGSDGMIRLTWSSAPGAPVAFPAPAVPFFPAGYSPGQADLNTWLHDPFAGLENRPVARLRQAAATQALPAGGAATVLEFDTVDEDPLGGWQSGTWAWGPPPGFSGWYQVTVTVATAALAAGAVIRPGVVAATFTGVTGSGYCWSVPGGVQGTFWVYLAGGQDTVQATGTLLNSSSNVNTSITAGAQSSMEVTWLAL